MLGTLSEFFSSDYVGASLSFSVEDLVNQRNTYICMYVYFSEFCHVHLNTLTNPQTMQQLVCVGLERFSVK